MTRPGIAYKDFVLYPRTLQPRDDSSWSIAVHIMRGPSLRPVSVSNTALTEEEAVRHSLELGRRVIDGEIPGISVDDL